MRFVNNPHQSTAKHSSYQTNLLNDSHAVLQQIAGNTESVNINTDTLEILQATTNTKIQTLDDRFHSFSGHTNNTLAIGDGSDQLRTVGLGYDRTNQKVRSILVDSGGKQIIDNPTFDALIGAVNNSGAIGDGSNQLRTVPLGYDRSNGKAVSFLVDAAGHQQLDVVSSALPTGASTATNQSTINTSIGTGNTTLSTMNTNIVANNSKLDTIDSVLDASLIKQTNLETLVTSSNTKLDTLDGSINVLEACVGSNKVNVNIASGSTATDVSALSTHAKQDTIIGHLDGVETLLTAANTDHAANEALLITIDEDTNNIKNSTAACATDLAAIEVLLTSANTDHAANEVLLTGIDSDTDAIKTSTAACATDLAALEVLQTATNSLLTAANTDHAANEALLITIDEDTNNIKNSTAACATDLAALEVLQTATNGLLTTIDEDTGAIKTDMAAIEVLLTAANTDHAANEVLLTAIDSDTNNIKNSTAACATDLAALEVLQTATNGLLTTIDEDTNAIKVDMAAIEVLLTAANTDHAANEVLLTAIDSDTNNIKNSTAACATDLAALEVLQTATNGLLTTIDADTNDIKTSVQLIDDVVKAEDAAHSSGDKGIMSLGVIQTTSSSLGANGDYAPLSISSTQHLRAAKELYNFSFTFPSSGTIGSGNMAESDVLTFTEKVSDGGYTIFITSSGTANHEVGQVLKGSMDGSAYFTLSSSLYATNLYNDGGTTKYFTVKDFNIKNIKIQITNNSSSSDDFEVFVCH